ncbi:MAG: hypothetical protein WAV28_12770 [Sedimentisphaerales bacterium]
MLRADRYEKLEHGLNGNRTCSCVGKPFLSTELCINNDKYQWATYRVALTMGQLYHTIASIKFMDRPVVNPAPAAGVRVN